MPRGTTTRSLPLRPWPTLSFSVKTRPQHQLLTNVLSRPALRIGTRIDLPPEVSTGHLWTYNRAVCMTPHSYFKKTSATTTRSAKSCARLRYPRWRLWSLSLEITKEVRNASRPSLTVWESAEELAEVWLHLKYSRNANWAGIMQLGLFHSSTSACTPMLRSHLRESEFK
jgi:hypothetical protein